MFPAIIHNLKFAIREVPAFVGHSFADKDKEVVDLLKHFLSKLGVKCDSGLSPEPKGVSEKVKQRILVVYLSSIFG